VQAPATRTLYYESVQQQEFDATVLWSDDSTWSGPDRCSTEGGAKPCDLGTLTLGDKTLRVTDVQKQDGVIIHTVKGRLKVGEIARGRIDWNRRLGHMRHHSRHPHRARRAEAVLGSTLAERRPEGHGTSALD